jgi:hypothetical protein
MLCCAMMLPAAVRALDLSPDHLGARLGLSATSLDDMFWQAEAFVDWNLPWECESDTHYYLDSRIELSAGGLNGQGMTAFVGTLGPTLRFGNRQCPVALDFGLSPTLLSDHQFGTEDFGMRLQFTTHVGLEWQIAPRLTLGYRFQHMSNGGFNLPNPGLNLHVLALSYRF